MTSSRTRLTATERSEQVLRAAVTAFAESGYAATKTDEIARLAGVSQPYVIRLFGSKQQLFLETTARVCDRIEELFSAAVADIPADADPTAKLDGMGQAYHQFLTERELPLVLLHSFSASGDPVIGTVVRQRFGNIYHLVGRLSGAPPEAIRDFVASGMLLTVLTAMQVVGPNMIACDWSDEILATFGEKDFWR